MIELDEWRAARLAIFHGATGDAAWARLGEAEDRLMKVAAPPGIEPGSPGFKGPSGPRPGAIRDWFSLPIALRQRWWRETDYGRLAPSAELAAAVGLVPPGGFEPPSPP